jgi:hypothetical protein
MQEPEGKNHTENKQTKLLAKLPPDWEELSEDERREWTAALGAKLLERFRNS